MEPAKKPKRAYRLSPEGRAQKTAQILRFKGLGGKANFEKNGREGMAKAGRAGAAARTKSFKIYKMTTQGESSAAFRKRRIEAEAAREEILESLIAAAKEPDAKTETISAALRELRAESDRLLAREKAAMDAERAAGKPVGLPPVSVGDIPPAENPPVSPSLAAD